MTTPEPGPTVPGNDATSAAGTVSQSTEWGRVDEHGVVSVRDHDSWRQVGEYPDASAAEALAYFERKYTDLASQVSLLEQRGRRGARPNDIAGTVQRMQTALEEPNAVGDLQALRDRVAALGGTVEDLTAQRTEEHKEALEAARAEREAIVVEAEALAARDPATVQWKATSQQMDALFARWQASQHGTVKLPKGEANDLWRRFRAARATIDTARRAFFAELDSVQRSAKEAKEKLVAQAEALRIDAGDAIGTYRALLDDWKAAGRAGRKVDDALWARFKAAGDALYAAKSAERAGQDSEFNDNLTAKLALLDEAAPLLTATDAKSARATLTEIQRRWDAVGRVPREQVRVVEDRLRAIEQHVKSLEQDHWRRTNPETKARATGLAAQLEGAIAKLEQDLERAKAAGDRKGIKDAEEALAARRIWLDAIER